MQNFHQKHAELPMMRILPVSSFDAFDVLYNRGCIGKTFPVILSVTASSLCLFLCSIYLWLCLGMFCKKMLVSSNYGNWSFGNAIALQIFNPLILMVVFNKAWIRTSFIVHQQVVSFYVYEIKKSMYVKYVYKSMMLQWFQNYLGTKLRKEKHV